MIASTEGRLVNIVTLRCRNAESAQRCLDALAAEGRPNALAYRCASYEFGLKEGTDDTVCLVEHWNRWEDLDALAAEKIAPALPAWNALLVEPFDPQRDTLRIRLSR